MKVLIISHNVLGDQSNMGKTLGSYFKGFSKTEIAQFYIRPEKPRNMEICTNYFQFDDRMAVKAIFSPKAQGKMYNTSNTCDDIPIENSFETAYEFGRKRTPIVYILRNALWMCTHWFSSQLKEWIKCFDPDVVFFASGDYWFMYKIALKISRFVNKPLVISCVDDFYTYNINEKSILGRIEYYIRMKYVRKTIAYASILMPICDSMGKIYQKLYNKPFMTMHTPAEKIETEIDKQAKAISYIGNLELGRFEQLIDIGKTIKALNLPGIQHIDVYSGEKSPEIVRLMTEENGIRFHGRIPASDVPKVMEHSLAVIHTESFDQAYQNRVRYSVSTKIAETLMYGPCLFAYGPSGIASIDYLEENHVAIIAKSHEMLKKCLLQLLLNERERNMCIRNARLLATQNHDLNKQTVIFRECLQNVISR